jgi:PAS domain S-box-containing protein
MEKANSQEILIVDDTPENLHLLTAILADHGYRVRSASSGQAALLSVGAGAPDLILLDVRMPEMDGYEVCRQLKSAEPTRGIPVIFVSILDETDDKVKGFDAGGVDYITKPFQPREVLARVRTHLDLRRLQLRMEELVRQRTAELEDSNELLRKSEERLRNLVETTSDWIWEVDANAVYTYVSPRIRDILGYSPEEVLGKTPFDFMSPKEAKRVSGLFDPIAASQKPISEIVNTNLHKDGRLVVLETSGVPFFDKDGIFLGYRGVDRDITLRRRAEEALRESEEKYRGIFENCGTALIFVEEDTTISMCNMEFEKLTGYSRAEVDGKKSWMDFVAKQDDLIRMKDYHRLRRVDPRAAPQFYESQCIDREGNLKDVVVSVTVIPGMKQSLAVLQDISQRKRSEEALRRRETELKVKSNNLEQLNAALTVLLDRREQDKNEFEGKVLSSIKEQVMPYMDLLKRNHLESEQIKYVDIIGRNIKNIVSQFSLRLSSVYKDLTEKEILVANLIRDGKTSKDMADILNVTYRAIEARRHNIRKKLGLQKSKNLRAYLLALS